MDNHELLVVRGTRRNLYSIYNYDTDLNISDKDIYSIWMKTLANLHIKNLNISNNPLSFLPDIYTLRILNCSNCGLKELPTYLPFLEELDCSNNLITNIPHYKSIKKIKCSNNPLMEVPRNTDLLIQAANCPILVIHYDPTKWHRSGIIKNGKFTWIINTPIESKYAIINWQESTTTINFKSRFAQKLSKFLFY